MNDSPKKDFFKFAFGFIAMISLGFVMLLGIGFYQVEIAGSQNISSVGDK